MRTLLPTLLFGLAIIAVPVLAFAQGDTFVPLTNLPGIQDAAASENLPSFFNNLYRLCIGAAAVIAVLQIMRAGAYFMFNKGSLAQNQKGKELIMNSVLGLLLVLSPAIVFGIINPDILDLRLDVSKIKPNLAAPPTEIKPDGAPLDRAPGGTAEENQDSDPRGLSHTCTSPDSIPRLQSELDAGRKTTPGGKLYLDIQNLGQGGQACCEAVKDADGSFCKAGTSYDFSRGTDSLTTRYTCTCGK